MKKVEVFENEYQITNDSLDLSGISLEKISDIKGLENLINLKELVLYENEISEIKGLESLENLELLSLGSNRISEIKGLNTLTNLKFLDLRFNELNEIKGLEYLINLQELILDDTGIAEIKGLDNLKDLKTLSLDYNFITEIENLDGLNNLEELYFNLNQINEIKNLNNLRNLRILGLESNKISGIKGLEYLKRLEILNLSDNPLEGIDEFYLRSEVKAQTIVEYCQRKIRGEPENIEFYDLRKNYNENLEQFNLYLEKLDFDNFINIGTHREFKKHRIIQNRVFFEYPVEKVFLSDIDTNFSRLKVHIIQLHSLKGIEDKESYKLDFFKYIIKHFWDNQEIEENKVLIYKSYNSRISNKIDEILDISIIKNRFPPNLVIFPENSIPYSKIDDLKTVSKNYNVIMIGGLEHSLNNASENYKNKAFIIDKGNIAYQIKQTPVKIIDSKNNDVLQERIICQKIPQIQIFHTSIGKVAIIICKDFLRLSDIISDWAKKNEVDLIVIPSLTSKVLPFHSKIYNILNYSSHRDLIIIFSNIGEYGGSELFSIDVNPQIEARFRRNLCDNIGETIVVREIDLGIVESIYSDKTLAFLKDWEKLERIFIFKIIVNLNREIKPLPQKNSMVLKLLQKNKLISEQILFDYYELRKIRNKLFISKKIITHKTLKKFSERLKDLIKSLEKIPIQKLIELI